MSRFFTYLAGLVILLWVVSCGYRTAPVPYSYSEAALPVLNLANPVFKGENMYLNWNDVSAVSFRIRIFQQGLDCKYCSLEPIDTIEISYSDDGVLIEGNADEARSGLIRYYALEQSHTLVIHHSVVERWGEAGFFYLNIDYRNEEKVRSNPSNYVRPMLLNPVPKPDVSIQKSLFQQEKGDLYMIIQWPLVVQTMVHGFQSDNVRVEKAYYYGLNLYEAANIYSSLNERKINDKPLSTGEFAFSTVDEGFHVCHVDRFGNESDRIYIKTNFSLEKEKSKEKP